MQRAVVGGETSKRLGVLGAAVSERARVVARGLPTMATAAWSSGAVSNRADEALRSRAAMHRAAPQSAYVSHSLRSARLWRSPPPRVADTRLAPSHDHRRQMQRSPVRTQHNHFTRMLLTTIAAPMCSCRTSPLRCYQPRHTFALPSFERRAETCQTPTRPLQDVHVVPQSVERDDLPLEQLLALANAPLRRAPASFDPLLR